jgi:MoaA/NifB/PqqE/SkfB family radical SAM enzyme
MIELGTRPTIVMQAAPFCFGPVSTSLAIAQRFREKDVAILWLAEGTALELLRAESGEHDDYIVPFSLSDNADRNRCAHFVEEADVVVVNTDPEFAEFAVGLNANTVYVDILYWMWSELPAAVNRCAMYVYEDFVRSAAQIHRVGLPHNARRVGPLIAPVKHRGASDDGHLLVSLGGLYRPGNQSQALLSSYRDGVLRAVIASLRPKQFKTIFFAGGGMEPHESSLPDGTTIRQGCLSRSRYQELLSTCAAAILSPGLTGFYEAIAARVPTFFLPPHNYSQFLQLETFRSVLPEGTYCSWDQLGVEVDLPCFLPEDRMLQRVDAALSQVTLQFDRLEGRLRSFLGNGHQQAQVHDSERLEALAGLSNGQTDGASVAADAVLDCVHGSTIRPANRRDFSNIRLPSKVTLELFDGCQLRCPLCPTGQRLQPERVHGPIAIETVRKLLDEVGDHVKVMELFNWGEPFLHPKACEIIRMIADRGIRTVVSSNLQRIPDPQKLVESGLSELIFSCHGMTQPNYEKYMVGGNLATALDNLDRILVVAGATPRMKIVLRFVVFAHNEHEFSLAHERFQGKPVELEAAPMRIDMRDEILAVPGRNLQLYGQWVPDSSRFYDKKAGRARRAPAGCNLPFEEVTIGVDGAVTTCCSVYDRQHTVGNFLSDGGLRAVWNGEAYQQARRVVSGRGERGDESIVCRTCKKSGYRDF